MRKLASIQEIREIHPIEGADAIEKARILGWDVVVKKDEFKPGDKAVYIEIDSIVPEKPEYEFLRAKKFRIKTIRLKKTLSQGIAFRVQDVLTGKSQDLPIGTDVTDILGIKHADEIIAARRKGLARVLPMRRAGLPFPGFIPKTDETRIQILLDLLVKYNNQRFYVTEKLDGSSFTAFLKDSDFGVCSRNWRLAKPGDSRWAQFCNKHQLAKKLKWIEYRFAAVLNKRAFGLVRWTRQNVFAPLLDSVNIDGGVDNNYWDLATNLDLESKMRNLGLDLAIQGEMIGPGIQGNKYNLTEKKLYVFSIINLKTNSFLNWDDLVSICTRLNLDHVPLIDSNFILNHTSDELLEMANGQSKLFKVKREGLVYRPWEPAFDTSIAGLNHAIVSFKAVSNKWLEQFDKA